MNREHKAIITSGEWWFIFRQESPNTLDEILPPDMGFLIDKMTRKESGFWYVEFSRA